MDMGCQQGGHVESGMMFAMEGCGVSVTCRIAKVRRRRVGEGRSEVARVVPDSAAKKQAQHTTACAGVPRGRISSELLLLLAQSKLVNVGVAHTNNVNEEV